MAEAFLDQEDEGLPDLTARPDSDDENLEAGAVVARDAPTIHKPKGKDQR